MKHSCKQVSSVFTFEVSREHSVTHSHTQWHSFALWSRSLSAVMMSDVGLTTLATLASIRLSRPLGCSGRRSPSFAWLSWLFFDDLRPYSVHLGQILGM